jgi:hypothetical protein
VACVIEQTNDFVLSQGRGLEIRHAQFFPLAAIHGTYAPLAARVDGLAAAVIHAHSTPCSIALDLCPGDWAPAVGRAASASGPTTPQDRAFIALQNAYRPHGGLSRLHTLNMVGVDRSGGQECEVGGLFAAGALFGFQWYGDVWIPLFQFTLPGPTIAAGPQSVVAELGRNGDGWALASWFVQPNGWLASKSPIECLDSRLPDVLEAARAERFPRAD